MVLNKMENDIDIRQVPPHPVSIAAVADWQYQYTVCDFLTIWRRDNKSFHDSSPTLRALHVLTIVRKNVCNKAKKRKLTFLDFEKRKIGVRILELWC